MDDPPFSMQVAEGVRAGDPDALAAVYRAVRDPMASYLRSQGLDEHTLEDVVEETFLELVKRHGRMRPNPYEIRAWLYKAARNNLIDHYRHAGRRPESLIDDMPDGPSPDRDPAERAIDADQRARLLHALEELTEPQRQVVTLRFLADLSAGEVAQVLGKRERAVRTLQHRAVAALTRLVGQGDTGLASPDEAAS